MSFQAPSAVALAINALRRSFGSLCTTPPGTRGLLTGQPYSASRPEPNHRRSVGHQLRAAESGFRRLRPASTVDVFVGGLGQRPTDRALRRGIQAWPETNRKVTPSRRTRNLGRRGDGTVDVVISEYGAAIWADPYLWIPEASHLLRLGGELILMGKSSLLMLCVPEQHDAPAIERLLRPSFDMLRFEWPDDTMVDFHLGHGDWIRLLRNNDFGIEDLMERRPRDGAASPFPFVTAEWARKWPSEEVWRARKVRR